MFLGEIPGEELVVLLDEEEGVLLQECWPSEAEYTPGERGFRRDCGCGSRFGHAVMIG